MRYIAAAVAFCFLMTPLEAKTVSKNARVVKVKKHKVKAHKAPKHRKTN